MAELDYQTALLLQNKFEQEKRDSQLAKELQKQFEKENVPNNREQIRRSSLSDSLIAQSLHEQFQTEMEVERPQQNLVYDSPNGRNSRQTGKSLTDPSWEIIDPTPDIHTLFIAFNERFFWNQLGSVTVSWSKRMTTCAGICSYQGRGGLCTITLSEPLLKLRPRKDLVETLLHEMIHAYLFVTDNNRDRDGHGPEFHRHMYRINSEAGTKITVYHNFHEEVNLYKTHWWRCNGPCQTRKPFFGLVRRATNRAPGPNDFWWAEHSRNCGGQFIKVKEPEKPTKQTKSKSAKNPTKSPDIRKFFPTNNLPKSKSDTNSNIKTVESKNETKAKINKVISNSANIFGFGNLNGDDCNCDKNGSNTKDNKVKKIVSTTGKTLGTKNPPGSVSNTSKGVLRRTNSESANSASKDGEAKSTPVKSSSNSNYDVVRNHWINKFSNTSSPIPKPNTTTPLKRPKPSGSAVVGASKIPKLSESAAECPVCSKLVPEYKINSHLDECLGTSELESTKCSKCGIVVLEGKLEEHLQDCNDDVVFLGVTNNSVDENTLDTSQEDKMNSDNSVETKICDICKKVVASDNFDVHVVNCLHSMFDRIEGEINKPCNSSTLTNVEASSSKTNGYTDLEASSSSSGSKATVQCLACNRKIVKSELDDHLENCLGLSQIFDDENEPVEEQIEAKGLFNCPSCMKLFSESEMNDHIDICLNISDV
ncbi:uncharacterized protein mh [Diabrotica undecimpunctata]|uniref:uncharacterized protein mh n=1 Tax=Diabrotica undecimpunctata TaxID=50387 RepID=UPI003B6324E6